MEPIPISTKTIPTIALIEIYPVRKPRHLLRGRRKKCSFLIEWEVQSPTLSNGVYLLYSFKEPIFSLETSDSLSRKARYPAISE